MATHANHILTRIHYRSSVNSQDKTTYERTNLAQEARINVALRFNDYLEAQVAKTMTSNSAKVGDGVIEQTRAEIRARSHKDVYVK